MPSGVSRGGSRKKKSGCQYGTCSDPRLIKKSSSHCCKVFAVAQPATGKRGGVYYESMGSKHVPQYRQIPEAVSSDTFVWHGTAMYTLFSLYRSALEARDECLVAHSLVIPSRGPVVLRGAARTYAPDCGDKSLLVYYVTLVKSSLTHAGVLVVDRTRKEYAYFDPNGASFTESQFNWHKRRLRHYVHDEYGKDFQENTSDEVCPRIGPQSLTHDRQGLCALWSVWRVNKIITHGSLEYRERRYSPNELLDSLYRFDQELKAFRHRLVWQKGLFKMTNEERRHFLDDSKPLEKRAILFHRAMSEPLLSLIRSQEQTRNSRARHSRKSTKLARPRFVDPREVKET